MPPCLCWRSSEHCSWVNNVFSNQLILLQAVAQASTWSNQSQPMEPGFCRLLALSRKVNCSWLCVCIKSEHPAADVLETPLGKTTSWLKSGCFHGCHVELLKSLWAGTWSSPHRRGLLRSHSTLIQTLPSKTLAVLQVLYLRCCCRSKIPQGPEEQQNCVFKCFASCACAKSASSTSTSHMQAGWLTREVPVGGSKCFALCETHQKLLLNMLSPLKHLVHFPSFQETSTQQLSI